MENTELELLNALCPVIAAAGDNGRLSVSGWIFPFLGYQSKTKTAQLAQELYASREHLSRAFKECTMESIHNYLTYLRMQHCRKALEEGVSVLNACTESGFPDYSSFLKTFRRLYSITPAEYRAQHRTMVR